MLVSFRNQGEVNIYNLPQTNMIYDVIYMCYTLTIFSFISIKLKKGMKTIFALKSQYIEILKKNYFHLFLSKLIPIPLLTFHSTFDIIVDIHLDCSEVRVFIVSFI